MPEMHTPRRDARIAHKQIGAATHDETLPSRQRVCFTPLCAGASPVPPTSDSMVRVNAAANAWLSAVQSAIGGVDLASPSVGELDDEAWPGRSHFDGAAELAAVIG